MKRTGNMDPSSPEKTMPARMVVGSRVNLIVLLSLLVATVGFGFMVLILHGSRRDESPVLLVLENDSLESVPETKYIGKALHK
jgi:hypothetical protein